MSNIAQEIILPPVRVLRVVFLYVGQGEATLFAVPEGDNHKIVLVDSNLDLENNGIDIPKLLEDLFQGLNKQLAVYINTHPHKDHFGGIRKIYDTVGIEQLWHSGHKPGGEHKEAYEDLEYVIKKLGTDRVFCLKGSREENKLDDKEVKLGDVNYNVLSPAEYVTDDIADEDPDARYRRIHEQCGVIRFRYGRQEKQILITGDANRAAWEKHITEYHKERLPSTVLSTVHHGSNTFFWENAEAEGGPYTAHLDIITPSYAIVSAPTREKSKHDHPHKEAMEIYEKRAGRDNVKHLGERQECVVLDIDQSGNMELFPDDQLVNAYGLGKNGGGKGSSGGGGPIIMTRLDRKPMG
ncbi:MAG: MBL fold metallo-hydrolase [Deltaproteobacteria bacterium]|nr:MBL fold metallo-hydrolase [Deltaproteobacteria bacterium]